MIIYAIDDEPLVLETLRREIQDAAPGAELYTFSRVSALLSALSEANNNPDVIFTDIEMPGMNGLELAVKIKQLKPNTHIVFVTGYSEYAVDAFRLHAGGYILKPVTKERIEEELSLLTENEPAAEDTPGKLKVRCFGSFEVFWKGEPLVFTRQKTKEFLAYLVDRRGELCTSGEIMASLWSEEGNLRSKKAYLRTLTSDLKNVLAEIGMEDLLIREHQQWAVRTQMLDCDYYRMLSGDVNAVNAFKGEYMSRYDWAEMTLAKLYFQNA